MQIQINRSLWNMQIVVAHDAAGLRLVPVADPICNSDSHLNLNVTSTDATAEDDEMEKGWRKIAPTFSLFLHFLNDIGAT